MQEWGGTAFTWADSDGKPAGGTTIWSVGPEEGDHYAPSRASFMINYRVNDLHALVAALKAEACNVLDKSDDSKYGEFAWVIDPEGHKVELWQPPPVHETHPRELRQFSAQRITCADRNWHRSARPGIQTSKRIK